MGQQARERGEGMMVLGITLGVLSLAVVTTLVVLLMTQGRAGTRWPWNKWSRISRPRTKGRARTQTPYRRRGGDDAFIIRALTAKDAPRLAEMAQQNDSTYDKPHGRSSGSQLSLGAECDGVLVGAIRADISDASDLSESRTRVDALLVDPAFGDLGVANLLFVRLLREVRIRQGSQPRVRHLLSRYQTSSSRRPR